MLRRIFLYFLSEKREVSVFNDFNLLSINRNILKTGFEFERSALEPLHKLTQASDTDVRIIVGKERESYEPELNYPGCDQSHPKNKLTQKGKIK